MADFMIPYALELENSRRSGIPAVRREVVHNTTTQNEYRPGELCYIPVDTGAAGAFMDVTTTKLEFSVVIRNKNFFTDFINLPRCGWNVLIQEFGIEINNVLHEQNRHYAECIELDMIRKGENRIPFEIIRSNPWNPAGGTAGNLHINFIKPSMVSAVGLPHAVVYPPMVQPQGATNASASVDTLTNGYLFNSHIFLHSTLGRRGYGAVAQETRNTFNPTTYATVVNAESGQSVHSSTPNLTRNAFNYWESSNMEIPSSFYDDRLWKPDVGSVTGYTSRARDAAGQTTAALYLDPSAFPAGAPDATHMLNGTSYGPDVCSLVANRLLGVPAAGQIVSYYSKMHAPDPALTDLGVVGAERTIFDVDFGQSVSSYTPATWPYRQPCNLEVLKEKVTSSIHKVNSENIHNYFANCKNIPVAIPINLSSDPTGVTTVWGNSVKTLPDVGSDGYETVYRVSMKVYSSLIGVMAKKWFPELVVPQGRMRIRLRFQEPQIAFQTLMDPCRRVPGTVRDFVPYTGVYKSFTNAAGTAATGINALNTCHVSSLAHGIHPIMVHNYAAGDVFTDAICLGKFPIPQMNMRSMRNLYKIFTPGWHHAATADGVQGITVLDDAKFTGGQFGTRGNVIDGSAAATLTALSTRVQLMAREFQSFLVKYDTELRLNQRYGFAPTPFAPGAGVDNSGFVLSETARQNNETLTLNPSLIGDWQCYTLKTDWTNLFAHRNIPDADKTLFNKAANTQVVAPNTAAAGTLPDDFLQQGLNWNPFCYPTPQYIPMNYPQDKTITRQILPASIDTYYCNENAVCFGTHLERAVAQVRRSNGNLYPLKMAYDRANGLYERLTYIVRDVQLVTQQLILPRTSAMAIVENALQGGITMETNCWKEIESLLPRARQQKHLINMAAAFCTDITFLFRPTEVFSGDKAFGYNSFSFYNPFTSFRFFTQTTGSVDTSAGTTIHPIPSSPEEYNYLGGEPSYFNQCNLSSRIGIKVQLQLGSELLPRTPIDDIHTLIRNVKWGDQVFVDRDYLELNPHLTLSHSTTNSLVINTLQDGFWACFVPIEALDDQTITDNPYFTPLELNIGSRIRGVRGKSPALPFYKPFEGSFHLSFNLESYMGQNDRMRTGIPIVNNNMFLLMEQGHLLAEYHTQLLTIVHCDGRVVFERGGTMQMFT